MAISGRKLINFAALLVGACVFVLAFNITTAHASGSKNTTFFIEFRKTNAADISGSLNLLGQLDLNNLSAEITKEIHLLMHQIVQSNKAHRNLLEQRFLELIPILASDMEDTSIRNSASHAFASFIIDRLEEGKKTDAQEMYLKLKKAFPEYQSLKSLEKFLIIKKIKVAKKLKNKAPQSFLANTNKAELEQGSSFPFGLVFLAVFTVVGFVFYRRRKNVSGVIDQKKVAPKKDTPKFDELVDFDEQLGLVN